VLDVRKCGSRALPGMTLPAVRRLLRAVDRMSISAGSAAREAMQIAIGPVSHDAFARQLEQLGAWLSPSPQRPEASVIRS
jgi:hypothetical protein